MPQLAAPRTGRLLVVDDDLGVRTVLVRLLKRYGHTVAMAADAAEAIALVNRAEEPYDVLVSDLGMPGKRGDALAAELMARMPALRVILITGDAGPDTPQIEALGTRAVVLRKPFATTDLERHVQRALEQR